MNYRYKTSPYVTNGPCSGFSPRCLNRQRATGSTVGSSDTYDALLLFDDAGYDADDDS